MGRWKEWKSAELANQSSQPIPLNRLINCDKISKKKHTHTKIRNKYTKSRRKSATKLRN